MQVGFHVVTKVRLTHVPLEVLPDVPSIVVVVYDDKEKTHKAAQHH
jgi:hypothetical protein